MVYAHAHTQPFASLLSYLPTTAQTFAIVRGPERVLHYRRADGGFWSQAWGAAHTSARVHSPMAGSSAAASTRPDRPQPPAVRPCSIPSAATFVVFVRRIRQSNANLCYSDHITEGIVVLLVGGAAG